MDLYSTFEEMQSVELCYAAKRMFAYPKVDERFFPIIIHSL